MARRKFSGLGPRQTRDEDLHRLRVRSFTNPISGQDEIVTLKDSKVIEQTVRVMERHCEALDIQQFCIGFHSIVLISIEGEPNVRDKAKEESIRLAMHFEERLFANFERFVINSYTGPVQKDANGEIISRGFPELFELVFDFAHLLHTYRDDLDEKIDAIAFLKLAIERASNVFKENLKETSQTSRHSKLHLIAELVNCMIRAIDVLHDSAEITPQELYDRTGFIFVGQDIREPVSQLVAEPISNELARLDQLNGEVNGVSIRIRDVGCKWPGNPEQQNAELKQVLEVLSQAKKEFAEIRQRIESLMGVGALKFLKNYASIPQLETSIESDIIFVSSRLQKREPK